MISKEERAELRLELSNAGLGFPLPWRLGEHADIVDDDGDAVADCMVENRFTGSSAERYIVAAANAAPKLLDALDAADERIAGLEAELNKLKGCNCDDANHGLTLDHRCIACSHIENCEERIAQLESWGREDCEPLKARIAELEAAAQWRPMATAPRDGTWILVLLVPSLSVKAAYPSVSILCFHNDPFADFWRNAHWERWKEDAGMGWLPIPALPEGGV